MKNSPPLDYTYKKTSHTNQGMKNLHEAFHNIFFMIPNIIHKEKFTDAMFGWGI